MITVNDGPATTRFTPLTLNGVCALDDLPARGISAEMAAVLDRAPGGECVAWGIPFQVDRVLPVAGEARTIEFAPTRAPWLVFMHTSDMRPSDTPEAEQERIRRGREWLGEHAADYVFLYDDGSEERVEIRRRFQVGMVRYNWADHCFNAVHHGKPRPVRLISEQQDETFNAWALNQRRVRITGNGTPWMNWLWAWQNPHPEKALVGLRVEPVSGLLVISAISAGMATEEPLRWGTRRKAVVTLPEGEAFDPVLDALGQLRQIRLDMGQVISAIPRPLYPNAQWEASEFNAVPDVSAREVLVEYTAHPDACFHLASGEVIPIASQSDGDGSVRETPPSRQHVTLRTVLRGSSTPVAVKLHVHGQAGEYLPPQERQRIGNPGFGEDYSTADYVRYGHLDTHLITEGVHYCTYIRGETVIDLPLGPVYIEITKGFEIRPLRKVVEITPETDTITIEIDKVLPWREHGWVCADPHVHFLSPSTALLEGAGEGCLLYTSPSPRD